MCNVKSKAIEKYRKRISDDNITDFLTWLEDKNKPLIKRRPYRTFVKKAIKKEESSYAKNNNR